jgi:hypothetical protein
VTLPSTAYRGHAAPTWDTKTTQQIIDYLQTNTVPILDNRYAPSAKAVFCDVNFAGSPAGATKQTIPNAQWTTLKLDTRVTDTTNSFNTANWLYTVPATGVYFCQALIRPNDGQVSKAGFPDGTGVAIGIGLDSDQDGVWVQWNKWMWMSGTGGNRLSWDYTRIASFNQGQLVRLYMFSDLGGQFDLTRATLQIWRVG